MCGLRPGDNQLPVNSCGLVRNFLVGVHHPLLPWERNWRVNFLLYHKELVLPVISCSKCFKLYLRYSNASSNCIWIGVGPVFRFRFLKTFFFAVLVFAICGGLKKEWRKSRISLWGILTGDLSDHTSEVVTKSSHINLVQNMMIMFTWRLSSYWLHRLHIRLYFLLTSSMSSVQFGQ